MTFFALSFSLFLVFNSIGSIPLFVAILGKYPAKKQRAIILRELLIALLILVLFAMFGNNILHLLGISQHTISVGGGIVLFIIAIGMIFSKKNESSESKREEPLIVPLAMPLVAGPGAITAIIIYSEQMQNPIYMLGAILAAWIPSLILLLASSNIKYLLGQKGLLAIQKLGGMLISLIAVQMISSGAINMIKTNFALTTH